MAPSKERLSLYWLGRNKPYWLVLASGLMLALSFPPSPFNFLIFVAFVPLLILFELMPPKVPEDKIFFPFKAFWIVAFRLLTLQFLWRKKGLEVFKVRRSFISGNAQLFRYTYLTFFIWNLLTCYWLMLTMLGAKSFAEGMENFTAGFLAVTLNPLLMSIPFQFFARIRHVLKPVMAAFALIVFWITFEYLHFNWDLTWSWVTLGHSQTYRPWLIQYIEFTGTLGISLHILLFNVLVYALIRHRHLSQEWSKKYLGAAAAALLLPLLISLFLMNPSRKVFQATGTLNVRVVQPVVDPYEKFNGTTVEQIRLFRDLILSEPLDSIDLVILPETAIPKFLNESGLRFDTILNPLWRLVDQHDISILTGMEEYKIFPAESAPPSAYPRRINRKLMYVDHYNAATVLRPDREIYTYQKSKLVPMVERIPFLGVLTFLKDYNIDLGSGLGGYGVPDSMTVLKTGDGIKVGVMICYESEFGDFSRQQSRMGARLMTVITNDGWWKQSSGYIQHAYFATLRAIENRRDIPRSANTGRSLFVDAWGYTSHETDWWTPAIIDKQVNLYDTVTFYARHGDYLGRMMFWLSILLTLGGIFYARSRKQKQKQPGVKPEN